MKEAASSGGTLMATSAERKWHPDGRRRAAGPVPPKVRRARNADVHLALVVSFAVVEEKVHERDLQLACQPRE